MAELKSEDRVIVDKIIALVGDKSQLFLEASNPLVSQCQKPAILFRGLMPLGIIGTFPPSGGAMFTRKGVTEPKKEVKSEPPKPTHVPKPKAFVNMKYYEPEFMPDILAMLTDEASVNIWLVGPTQVGKSRLVQHLGEKLDRKVYKIPCRGDMDSTPFYGQKTVKMDANGNKVVMDVPGIVELAMKDGLDAEGNVVGDPSILFIDEASSLPAHIAIGLNSFFETDSPIRKLHLEDGRVVKSHPKFRVILAGNTNGRGAQTMAQNMYSAQTNQLDMSLLNRIGVYFTLGYNRKVEHHLLMELTDDPAIVKKIEDFRAAFRGAIAEGKVASPLSTKRLIDIANSYRVMKDLGKAFHYSLMSYLPPEERRIAIEFVNLKCGVNISGQYISPDCDYLE